MEDAYDEKYEYKKELDSVDKQIDEQEALIKECNNANETFSRIRKSMDRCIDLLSLSVKETTTLSTFGTGTNSFLFTMNSFFMS